jgi:hypothetical protein
MDWVISFPESGNPGKKYLDYNVLFSDLKKGDSETQMCLDEILEKPEFERNFPHTIGFFKESIEELVKGVSTSLEIRIIRSTEEYWKFLNDLDL